MAEKELGAAKAVEIVDPHDIPIVFVDWIVTGGIGEGGAVNVALGSLDYSLRDTEEALPRVVVSARLRCTREFAHRLHSALGGLLGVSPPEGQEPQPDPKPLKNMIN